MNPRNTHYVTHEHRHRGYRLLWWCEHRARIIVRVYGPDDRTIATIAYERRHNRTVFWYSMMLADDAVDRAIAQANNLGDLPPHPLQINMIAEKQEAA